MSFQAVIFDLDGTLLDTIEDLKEAVNLSLERHGFPKHDSDAYRRMVGNGVMKLVELAMPADARAAERIALLDREVNEYLAAHPVTRTRPYPGVPELLGALQSRGVKTAILSNKPDHLTQKVVGVLLASWRFADVQGQRSGVPRKPDPAAALSMAHAMGASPDETLFLGDSDVDMKTAVAASMYPVGAAWGFRGAEELKSAGARRVINAPLELLDLLG